MTDPLDRLAELAGIQAAYRDKDGKRHTASAETKRALLAAMGIACEDDTAAEASLEAWAQKEWSRPLPPVQVITVESPWRATLRIPDRALNAGGRWYLALENGDVREDEIRLDASMVRERRRLGDEAHLALDLELPPCDTTGYHRFGLELDGFPESRMTLIVCPPTCYLPPAVTGENRAWGIGVSLYGVRSARNWGVGDFTDLKTLVEWAAESGAGLVGLNPLHSLSRPEPGHCNPFQPSSRCFFHLLYLDLEAVPEFSECDDIHDTVTATEFQARLRALRAAPLIDHGEVWETKFPLLKKLYRHFRDQHLAADTPRARAFREWVAEQGEALRYQALFDALQTHFAGSSERKGEKDAWGWPTWPSAFHNPHGDEVENWAEDNQARVDCYRYLYWLADCQLHAVGRRSYELGLGVGLCPELAPGADREGAETWSRRELYALEAQLGAPPDEDRKTGRDTFPSTENSAPLIPHRLRESAYQPFIRMLRANMREAGGVHIGSLMGLMQRYWMPAHSPSHEGAYVSYPFRELMGILALESQRLQCLVVGDDRGCTHEIRQSMRESGILAQRLFYFERHPEDRRFKLPGELAPDTLMAVTDRDHPTLAGFWQGVDLDVRSRLGLLPSDAQRQAVIVQRAEDRARLLLALEQENLLPEGMTVHPVTVPELTPPLTLAIHQYLARSPARAMLVQAGDMLGELAQDHLPGTTDNYPNWRHKLPLNLEEWGTDTRLRGFAEAMVAERGTSVTPRVPAELPACSPLNAPRATYRLQLSGAFTFSQARELVPYLADLGISHIYCSPILRARPGSEHGYDIIDHTALNPELGSPEDFESLLDVLEQHGMGILLDIVPNHMGVMGSDNQWWLDVLENGQASDYADFFDIDWDPVKAELKGRVLVPVLGDHYGAVLERGELKLDFDAQAGQFSVWYWEHCFPVDPREYPQILAHRMELLGARLGEEHPDFLEYQSLTTAFSHLPSSREVETQRRAERNRDKEIHKRHLSELTARNPDILFFLWENVALFNAIPAEASGLELMDRLLGAQPYRLAHWRVAADEINYRRFFDINDLAALRMEREEVFRATHRLIEDLMARGRLAALRIDHIDGLYAPNAYLARLRRLYREAQPTATDPPYLLVEKILAPHERLPPEWQICGTTGYDFANLMGGLFVDGNAADAMERIWRSVSKRRDSFDETLYQAKRAIMKSALASELNMLANRLARIAEADRHTQDYTLIALRGALMEVAACFPVYRTYIGEGEQQDEDRQHIEWACNVAKKHARTADVSVFDFLRDVLLTTAGEGKTEAYRQAVLEFAMRYQQFTSPVTAKGMEDTAFYRYHRLVSLNEVGGEPRRFGVSIAAFHHVNQERSRTTSLAMLATSTHDNKRSEDVRMRIHVLSEIPAEWRRMVSRWHRSNRSRLGKLDGTPVPTRGDEYLLYQTLIGTWPLEEEADFAAYVDRIRTYMVKAVREAKEVSSWINPDPDYEEKLGRFVEDILPPKANPYFLQEFASFARRIAYFGRLNSLTQTLLKLTCPGVPDIYQGTELWTDSLVDPDNRRPVDYPLRVETLKRLDERATETDRLTLCRELLADLESGAAKFHLLRQTLAVRREWPDLFAQGDYRPIDLEGPKVDHLIAFARTWQDQTLVAVAPRLAYTLLQGETVFPQGEPVWGNTVLSLSPGDWRNVLTGETLTGDTLTIARVLSQFPVALLRKIRAAPID
ncbi:MAG: hypothetical protein Kow0060_13750 [Methylohalobius crimeensis]